MLWTRDKFYCKMSEYVEGDNRRSWKARNFLDADITDPRFTRRQEYNFIPNIAIKFSPVEACSTSCWFIHPARDGDRLRDDSNQKPLISKSSVLPSTARGLLMPYTADFGSTIPPSDRVIMAHISIG